MERQLRDVYERGEPLAALTASESSIYGRFGYGVASLAEAWQIDREQTAFARPVQTPGRVRFVEKDEARKLFPGVYDRVRSQRIGMTGFQDYWWDFYLADLTEWRRGASAAFYVVYEEGTQPLGYAVYRLKETVLRVQELMAVTDEAYVALWSYCFGVDLISSIEARRRATDEPLPWMLAAPRKLERKLRDHVWLRLVDVAAALAARLYERDDSLVFNVEDSFCEWNEARFELVGGPESAECRTSNKAADLALSAADLASTYLGGVRFTTLASAGRVEELTPGAVQRADAMFATPHQPWTPKIM
jgi:predicted acetyltransferase